MTGVSEIVKKAVRQIYKNKCQYCECDGANHVDHILPQSKDGGHDLENLTLACERCNLKKSDLIMPDMYFGILIAQAKKKKVQIEKLLGKWERQKERARLKKENKSKSSKPDFQKSQIRIIPGKWCWFAPDNFSCPVDLLQRILNENLPIKMSKQEGNQLKEFHIKVADGYHYEGLYQGRKFYDGGSVFGDTSIQKVESGLYSSLE